MPENYYQYITPPSPTKALWCRLKPEVASFGLFLYTLVICTNIRCDKLINLLASNFLFNTLTDIRKWRMLKLRVDRRLPFLKKFTSTLHFTGFMMGFHRGSKSSYDTSSKIFKHSIFVKTLRILKIIQLISYDLAQDRVRCNLEVVSYMKNYSSLACKPLLTAFIQK